MLFVSVKGSSGEEEKKFRDSNIGITVKGLRFRIPDLCSVVFRV